MMTASTSETLDNVSKIEGAPFIENNNNQANIVKFLMVLRPCGLQNMVAIPADSGGLSAQTFMMPDEVNEAASWCFKKNALRNNVYFTPNPVSRRIDTKPKKEDLDKGNIDISHLDVDPSKELIETLGYDQARQQVHDADYGNDVAFKIDSGNGLGVFYRHERPVSVEQVEKINKHLIDNYGGDKGTGNAERLMRMPYTINYSSRTKLKKGYPQQTYSTLLKSKPVFFDENRFSSIDLNKCEQSDNKDEEPVDISDPWCTDKTEYTKELLELLDPDMEYADWIKIGMAVQAEFGDVGCKVFRSWSEKGRKYIAAEFASHWKSFSLKPGGVSFGSLVDMVKQQAGEDAWKAVWGKYSCLNKKDSKWLKENIVVIAEGSQRFYDLARHNLMTSEAFNSVYGHIYCCFPTVGNGSESRVTPASYISRSPDKLIADGITWFPVPRDSSALLQVDGKTMVNSYRPIQMEPVEGDVQLWQKLMQHVYGDYAEIVKDHMAFTLQHPDKKIGWGIVVIGNARTGKSATLAPLVKIFGSAAKVLRPDETDTNYDNVYEGKKVLVYEELYKPGDKKFFNALKLRITNNEIEHLNIKCKGMITQKNVNSIYAFTNHENAIHVTKEESQKLLVIGGPKEKVFGEGEKSEKFYTEYFKALDAGWLTKAVYYYLLHRDVSGFKYGVMQLKTTMFDKLLGHSKPDYLLTLEERLAANQMPHTYRYGLIQCGQLCEFINSLHGVGRKVTNNGLSVALKEAGYRRIPGYGEIKNKGRINYKGSKYSFYILDNQERYAELDDLTLVKIYLNEELFLETKISFI